MKVSHPMRIARRPLANPARLNYWTDTIAFAAGVVVFSTGFVLLTQFHMGEGALNTSALGASRLAWVNIHRLMATVLVAAVSVHIYLHWHSLTVRVTRAYRGLPGKAVRSDLILYSGFGIELLAGFVAWFVIPGSSPLMGPVRLTHLEPARHVCIDIHNLSGLVVLPAVVIHIHRHFGWLVRASR